MQKHNSYRLQVFELLNEGSSTLNRAQRPGHKKLQAAHKDILYFHYFVHFWQSTWASRSRAGAGRSQAVPRVQPWRASISGFFSQYFTWSFNLLGAQVSSTTSICLHRAKGRRVKRFFGSRLQDKSLLIQNSYWNYYMKCKFGGFDSDFFLFFSAMQRITLFTCASPQDPQSAIFITLYAPGTTLRF